MEGTEKVFKQVSLSAEEGAPVYALRVFTVEPEGFTPKENFSVENSREFINILICILGKK